MLLSISMGMAYYIVSHASLMSRVNVLYSMDFNDDLVYYSLGFKIIIKFLVI